METVGSNPHSMQIDLGFLSSSLSAVLVSPIKIILITVYLIVYLKMNFKSQHQKSKWYPLLIFKEGPHTQ